MAVTLLGNKILSFNVGQAVSSRLNEFARQRQEIQTQNEIAFYESVNKGMSYQDQLTYRQSQLDKEKARDVPDETYIKAIRKEIATLKKSVANDRFKNAYLAEFTKLKTGMQTYDDHIRFLQDQLSQTEDPDMRSQIQEYLSGAKQQQYQVEQAIQDNYYQFAQNDKTIPVLNKALQDVSNEKAKALGNGDKARYSALTLKEQSLQKTLTEAQIDQTIHEFALKKLKAYNPADLVQTLTDKINAADTKTPITYNGQTYNSAREFWETQKSQYFNGGEFDQAMVNYYGNVFQIAQNQSQDAFAFQLKQIKSQMDQLLTNPALADFRPAIQGSIAGILSKGTQYAADYIVNQAATKYNFQDAVNRLNQLQRDTGVDQTNNYFKLVNVISQVKSAEVQGILAVVRDQISNGKSPEDALNFALSAYNKGQLGTQPSPEQLATKTPGDIATAATGQGATGPDTRTTIGSPYQFKEGDIIKSPTSPTAYKFEGGMLRPIAGSPTSTEADFQKQFGIGYAGITTVPNLETLNLPKGQDIPLQPATVTAPTGGGLTMPTTTTPRLIKTKTGLQYGSFAPQTVFALEGATLRPISSLEKMQQIAPGGKAEEVDLSFFNDKTIGAVY